ncbi:hypothetical protein DI53_1795 [Sphingobacterium deserti]|uniref:Uncharacterized protein n=1 Tax=Sphingobacterium deserti TaxID=1229276 RepID=A0A0B8T4B1_9SPHI|nr:hypothetical protein DI53_1795 [Sphingobacterium deserti]
MKVTLNVQHIGSINLCNRRVVIGSPKHSEDSLSALPAAIAKCYKAHFIPHAHNPIAEKDQNCLLKGLVPNCPIPFSLQNQHLMSVFYCSASLTAFFQK